MEDTHSHGIINVLGRDSVGIIAGICTYLSNNGINILDIWRYLFNICITWGCII